MLRLPFFEAAPSATRDDRTEVSIWAEEVDEASFSAIAAAAAFFCSSSELVVEFVNEVTGCGDWTRGPFDNWRGGFDSVRGVVSIDKAVVIVG